jgi:transketolase
VTRYADIADLDAVARRIRGRLVRMAHTAKSPHVASALSCVDVLVAAYWGVLKIDPQRPDAPERDRFVLSEGRAAAALYAVLAERGFFAINRLDDYGRAGASLPDPITAGCVPGIEAAAGLPEGLSAAIELARAPGLEPQPYRVFVLLSDGECERGAVWEAAHRAAAERLGRLTAIVDANRPQPDCLPPLDARWRAFGWRVQLVDGHDLGAIIEALAAAESSEVQPRCLIAATTSGKGVSFMEGDEAWRDRPLTPRDLAAALAELRSML